MNKELLALLESLKLDEETKKKILESRPTTRSELIRLATQLGIAVDFDAAPVELDDAVLAKVTGGAGQQEDSRISDGY